MDLLDVRNLNLSFTSYGRKVDILKDVSLKIAQGQRVALIGETGSGKSITSKAVLNTLPGNADITGGEVLWRGEDLLKKSDAAREGLKGIEMSVVMQDPLSSFNPVFTIGRHLDDVLFWADRRAGRKRGRGERRAHITQVLRKVQLSDPDRVIRSYPSQLSGGMRQRVLIALALMNKPALLIADEPGTALDVTTQDEILKLINGLVRDEGLSLLMITHNLGVVRMTADYVYVMCKGEVVEHGPLKRIFEAPQTDYTRELIGAIPPLYGAQVKDQPVAAGETMIHLDGVSKTFTESRLLRPNHQTHAVRGVDIDIRTGEIFGLAGESGSGKTTVARMVMGIMNPSQGRVTLDGVPLQEMAEGRADRSLAQIVYQNPGTSLNPKRTIGQTLSVPLNFAGLDRKDQSHRMDELLERVDLPRSFISRYPHELSGGQKQRVAIARALAANPRLIVLDEPTSALDVSVQKRVIALLEELRDELGLTYLFISHDLSLMRNFCSRIAIMLRGELVEQGTPREVFGDPQHPYTRALIAAIPVITDAEEAAKPSVTLEEKQQFLVSSAA
ncbi:dipeptide ABC transporter ATP-binding protein [Qingshengfaniella alkalisoli]|uniref:ABC transporter ATP-binding protein n=1 Tax=Qingshengfaniella alkalisoli TaxID=2599296 RepID=A0A5B8I8W1_9RHOB|nr:ABC transporter ATP-binding protein [Qingshengfaniella alkalisoli]QDY70545.1 ABC transporter ATP-binding protein [Qingshengfaniella alkalisoli]